MEYYIFNTLEEAQEKDAEIYDLHCVQPRIERTTLYAYGIFSNGTKFAMEYDGTYGSWNILNGMTPETEQEVITQGYDLKTPIN